jgi:hypothetical protein
MSDSTLGIALVSVTAAAILFLFVEWIITPRCLLHGRMVRYRKQPEYGCTLCILHRDMRLVIREVERRVREEYGR